MKLMQTNFNITPSEFRKLVGLSQQRISQLIQNRKLIEGKHFQRTGTKFYLYSKEAVKLLQTTKENIK
jgi:hypothetical protein